jgi:hypothetical protein
MHPSVWAACGLQRGSHQLDDAPLLCTYQQLYLLPIIMIGVTTRGIRVFKFADVRRAFLALSKNVIKEQGQCGRGT